MVCVCVCISRYLKEELAWAIDKQLWIISNIMLFKTVIPLRNYEIKPFHQFCMHCYVALI